MLYWCMLIMKMNLYVHCPSKTTIHSCMASCVWKSNSWVNSSVSLPANRAMALLHSRRTMNSGTGHRPIASMSPVSTFEHPPAENLQRSQVKSRSAQTAKERELRMGSRLWMTYKKHWMPYHQLSASWLWGQWRSQNTADTRAQRGHTTFVNSLVSRPRPALSHL